MGAQEKWDTSVSATTMIARIIERMTKWVVGAQEKWDSSENVEELCEVWLSLAAQFVMRSKQVPLPLYSCTSILGDI